MLIHATEEEMQFIEGELQQHKLSGGLLEVEIIPENDDSKRSPGYEATTLLHLATKYGNVKVTQYLVDDGYNVDIRNPSGCTPLIMAVKFNEIKVAEVLLMAKADIFLRDDFGVCAAKLGIQKSNRFTELILARIKIIFDNPQAIAKKLLELNCSLTSSTTLKDASIVRHMLDSGRAVDEPDPDNLNRTALHYAVLLVNKEIVDLLLDRGIDPNVVDAVGKPPLFYYDPTSTDTREKLDILKIMLSKGASLTVAYKGLKFLQYLCFVGKKGTISTIVEYNESLLAAGQDGFNLLKFLVCNENREIIEILQNQNWNFDNLVQPETLLYAVLHANPKVFEYMLRKGVNLEAMHKGCKIMNLLSLKDIRENQEELLDKNRNYLKCVEHLLCHGADAQHIVREKITVLHGILESNNFTFAKIVLGHLALKEELGQPIKELIMTTMNGDVRFKKYFEQCKRRLEKMKRTVVYNSITLFRFLTEEEKRIVRYARNQDLITKLKFFMYHKRNSKMYYNNVLRERLNYSSQMAKLEDNAVAILLEIDELKNNQLVAHMIVDYLDYFDLLRFA